MAKRTSLREFQQSLAARLASAKRGETGASTLGVESGGRHWLFDLTDSGEVVPMPPLWPVPLTKPWLAGIANVRGTLYTVVDFAAFRGQEPTPRNADARLLLVGARHGGNGALLVERTLGLRNAAEMGAVEGAAGAEPWLGETLADREGRHWTRLALKTLLDAPEFLDVGL